MVHEIDHALGLPHSENRESVMYAFASDKSYPVELSEEDVFKIRQLYGESGDDPPASTTVPPTATTPRSGVETDLCALRRVDSVLVLDEKIFVAHGRHVWPIDIEGRPTTNRCR